MNLSIKPGVKEEACDFFLKKYFGAKALPFRTMKVAMKNFGLPRAQAREHFARATTHL
jgi:hypothetical protein